MVGKCTHFQVIQKQSKFAITDVRQKPGDSILLYDTGVGFNSRNNFANLGSFAKFSIPVQFIIPW